MLPCRHRLVPGAVRYCFLETAHGSDDDVALVFQGESGQPLRCLPEMAAACPFREWEEPLAPKFMVPCPHCRRRHRHGSNSQQLCAAWASTKDALAELRRALPEGRRFYPEGTTLRPYADDTTPLIRRLVWEKLKTAVLRRDRYRCQDCGAEFGARRRKVFDRRLRRGRGGYRWESLEVHHIIARSDGGSDHPGNLKTLCPGCHRLYTQEQAAGRTAVQRERRSMLRSLAEEGYGDEAIEDPRD